MQRNKLEEKVNQARLDIFVKDPFFGFLLQHIEIIIKTDIETAYTNGKDIYIGELFLEKLSLNEAKFILMHELLHIVLNHVSRGKDLDRVRYNVACDIVVNDILKFYFFPHDNLEAQFGETYSINGYHMNVEEVYKALPKQIKSSILDQHDLWDMILVSDIEMHQKELQEILEEAKSKGYGIKNNYLLRKINRYQLSEANNRWLYLLERYMTSKMYDYTYQKTDHRYENVLLPSFIENEDVLFNIWFLIDVSGSMDKHLLSMMFGEINRIISHYKSIECDVSFFSNETTEPMKFRNKKELLQISNQIKTTIGTDFIQIFDALNQYYPYDKPKLIIIFSDGYARLPHKEDQHKTDVLWVTNNKNFKPTFGKVIHINE